MEKLIYLCTDDRARQLERSCATLRANAFGLHGLTAYVCEAAAALPGSKLGGVRAVVSAFIPCLDRRQELESWLARHGGPWHGYLASESVPVRGRERLGVDCRLLLLQRSEQVSHAAWLERFERSHDVRAAEQLGATHLARNLLVRPLAMDAPSVRGLVELAFDTPRPLARSTPDPDDGASAWRARDRVELYARCVTSFGAH